MSDFLRGIGTASVLWAFVFFIQSHYNDKKEKIFLSYCTAHGDKYEVCAKAWEEGEMK